MVRSSKPVEDAPPMPLTSIQKEVLALIAGNRSPQSHFAGGVVLNAADDSTRFSQDFDIFHGTATEVTEASENDAATLIAAGFAVKPATPWKLGDTFRKAEISRNGQSTDIDWAADSTFRFFPVEKDPVLGWRLHLFDIATNKALALAARSETRDYVDILELSRLYPLAAICWAACGKDQGYSPLFLLKMMLRFAKIVPGTLEKIKAKDLNPIAMKQEWIEISDQAGEAILKISNDRPDLPIGCAFVDANGRPRWIEDEAGLQIHFGSNGGSWK